MQAVTTLAAVAEEASGHFTTRKRDNDESYTTLSDDAPEWLHDLVRVAHGDMLPDDWRYQTISAAIDYIAETEMSTDDDEGDFAHEFADQNVDTYTGERFAWLTSHLSRQGYVDQAREEGLIGPDTDIANQIGIGQYEESREVFASVLASLRERL